MSPRGRNVLAFVLLSVTWLSQPMCVQPRKIGSLEEVKYRADMTGDGVDEAIVMRKTVTDAILGDRYYYSHEVRFIVFESRKGAQLFESNLFETNEMGVFVTTGEMRVLKGKQGPARFEYVETKVYTEGPQDEIVARKVYLFSWNGEKIEVREREEKG